MSSDWMADVREFHDKFAPHIPQTTPRVPDAGDEQDYCFGFMEEELYETKIAMERGDVAEVADGLADLIYVAIRAALIWGIDLRPVWQEVHRANMEKEGGHLREDGKLIKPPGWQPPDIEGVLRQQGWDG